MIVESLRHQLQCQRILGATGLFQLGPLVLEPDLDLRLIQAQFATELLATLLGQVAILVELVLRDREREEEGESVTLIAVCGARGKGKGAVNSPSVAPAACH